MRQVSLDISELQPGGNILNKEFTGWAGEINVFLVNNAGILLFGAFENIDIKSHQEQSNINVNGVINSLPCLHSLMSQNKLLLHVINLSSFLRIYGASLDSFLIRPINMQ